MYCTAVPWPNAYVTSVALHPTRPSVFVATRRPHAFITEMNLLAAPATVIGVPVPTSYSVTQLFVVVTDAGADRVVAVAEDRTVDVYSWQSGGALLFRHVPRGTTLRDAAIRIAMADIRSEVLFMVPLMRMADRGKSIATERLPSSRLYYAKGHPDEVLLDANTNRIASSRPSSRVYWFNCFKANNQEKSTPYLETDVPVVGIKLHPDRAPILAVLCADAGLRLYDLDSDNAKNGEPVLYNVIDLNAHCGNLQLPSFSKLWVNGDGRSKVFDFVPTPSWAEHVTIGNKAKLRKVYRNLHIAVADCRKVVVLDLTVPGECSVLFFATAPTRIDYLGVVCDPVGTHRCSGAASSDERSDTVNANSSNAGSRRLLWALTSQGLMQPLTMDDEICAATKVLSPAEWVPSIPMFQWAASLAAPACTALRRVDQMGLSEAYSALYGPTVGATAMAAAAPKRSSTLNPAGQEALTTTDVVAEWSSQDALLRQKIRNDATSPLSLLQGKVLRMHVAFHPQLPFVVMTTPVEGTFSARRLPTRSAIARRPVSLTAVCTAFAPPASTTTTKVLAGRSTHVHAAVCATSPFSFVADARAGVSVLRVVAADAALVANVLPDGAPASPGQPTNVGPRGVATASTLLCQIGETGQVAVSSIESIPLAHLGALNPSTATDILFPAARYVLVLVTYVVATSMRTLTDSSVPKIQTLLMLVDQVSIVNHAPAMPMDSMLHTKQHLTAASAAVKLLKVLSDTTCAATSIREPSKPCVLLCDERRGRFASNARDAQSRWRHLDLSLLTLRHVDGTSLLSDDLSELAVESSEKNTFAAALNRAGCSDAFVFEDTLRVADYLQTPAPSTTTINSRLTTSTPQFRPLCVAYNANTRALVVPSRDPARPGGAYTTTSASEASRTGLFASPLVLLAATNRAEDDAILAVVVTFDRRVQGYVFGAEDAATGQRPWHLATSGVLPAHKLPTRVLFVGAMAICEMTDSSVVWFTFGSPQLVLRPLITLPSGALVAAASADRIVAATVVPRQVIRLPDNSLAIAPSEIIVGHCSVPMLPTLIAAEVDLASNRLNNLLKGADPAALASNLAATVTAFATHLSGQANLLPLGPLLTLARLGFHCLVADVLKVQSSIIADGCLALQPSALRAVATQVVPSRVSTGVTVLAPTERIDTWPVPTGDALLLHAERARQFTAIRHHQDTEGALVVTDGPATLIKKGGHAPAVSSVTLGMPAAHAALHQISWISSNERGQYAFDLLVVIASHVPFGALPPDTAQTLDVVIFSNDAATYRAYRVVCHSFGAATPATALFVDNIKAARNGRHAPRIVTAHHLRNEETTLLAKKNAALNPSVATAFDARDTFMNVVRSKSADVRLGNGDNGRLSTVVFPLHRSVVLAFGGEDEGNVPGSYLQLRTLLTQSSLALWPLVSSHAAAEDEEQNEQAVVQLAMAGGGAGVADAEQQSAVSGGKASQAASRPAASIVGVMARPAAARLPSVTPSDGGESGSSVSTTLRPAQQRQQQHQGDDALGQPSEASLAEAQQRALREEFLGATRGKRRGAAGDDSSSDDGTTGPKFEIKLRDATTTPSSAVGPQPEASPAALNDTGAFALSASSALLSTSTSAPQRRRIGGSDSTVASAPPKRDVDDMLGSAFVALDHSQFVEANAEFTAAATALVDAARAGSGAEQAKLRLVAQYRVLCGVQLFLESDAAAVLPPSQALAAAVHCAHLRIANEHLAVCLRDALNQTVLLQWPATSSSLLSIVRSFAPELLETHEGQELEEKVNMLPYLAPPAPSVAQDDAFVSECLAAPRMCCGSFVVYATADEAASDLVACPFCELRFSPKYLATQLLAAQGPAALGDGAARVATCSACLLGQMTVAVAVLAEAALRRTAVPSAAAAPPAAPAVVTVEPPPRLVALPATVVVPTPPPSSTTAAAATPLAPFNMTAPSQVAPVAQSAPPPPPVVVAAAAPVAASNPGNDLDFLFGMGGQAPAASPPRRFGAPPPPPPAATVPAPSAAYVDPFGGDFFGTTAAPKAAVTQPPSQPPQAPPDMDAFFA